jgi:NAD(P)-dependent dehydrogenase (short-subunit alcohol dehydrogenase family)
MSDLFSVSGKVAVVTGGSSGIGLMIARGLVEHGVKTYIVARNADKCATRAAELSESGECYALPGDLSTLDGIQAVASAFSEKETRLDILVNNAGVMAEAPLDEFTEEDWDSVADLNLKSPFFVTQRFLPFLRAAASENVHASVIAIGSVGGLRVGPKENYSYSSTKAGLHHLVHALAKRLASEHITVNAIAPGFFPSGMTQITEEIKAAVLAAVPRRRVGVASDVVGATLYLSSRAGSFVTGSVMPVEGGMTL